MRAGLAEDLERAPDLRSIPGIVEDEVRRTLDLDELPLELLESGILDQVEVVGVREGGKVDCFVPFSLVDNEEVPVKKEWAESLARQMGDIAGAEGGNGQHTPVTLGFIPGEPTLKIMDGFHRSEGLRIRGETHVYATLKLTDWDGLYDFRIFTAKDHTHVRFSRVVQWIREVWDRSPLSQLQTTDGDQLTVTQAILLYRYDTAGNKLGLNPADVEKVKAWVERKEQLWDIAAMTIHSYLKIAETVDPQLVHSTREKKSGRNLDAPTQIILKIFSDELPNKFDLQNLVMQTAMKVRVAGSKDPRCMNGPEIRALCQKVADCDTLDEARALIDEIDWNTWEPSFGRTKEKILRRSHDPRHQGRLALRATTQELSDVRGRVRQALDRKEAVSAEHLRKINEASHTVAELIDELGGLAVELAALAQTAQSGQPKSTRKSPDTSQHESLNEGKDSLEESLSEAQTLPPAEKPSEPQASVRAKAINGSAEPLKKPNPSATDTVKGRELSAKDTPTPKNVSSSEEVAAKHATIEDAITTYLAGKNNAAKVPIPKTPAEIRQFKAAMSRAVEQPHRSRPKGWAARFQELQKVLAPDAVAAAMRSKK